MDIDRFVKRQFSTTVIMNHFTPKQRAEIVTLYIENSRSVVLTQRAYRRNYRGQRAPCDNTIRRLVSNFVEYGTVRDRQHAVRQQPRRSTELVEVVRESVAQNPKCRIAAALSSLALVEALCGVF
nr:unnamed protein product [Callosobruchus analis]